MHWWPRTRLSVRLRLWKASPCSTRNVRNGQRVVDMRREEETQAALEAALVENKRLRAEIELLKNPAGHLAPVPDSASNDSGVFLCPPSAGIGEVTAPADKAAKGSD